MATRYKQRRQRQPRKPRDPNLPIPPARPEVVMERALRLLAARGRSVEEMRERLLSRDDVNEELAGEIVDKLIEYRYLDDVKFAHEFSGSKVRVNPMGRRRLQRELENKKVAEHLIREALDATYEKYPEEDLVEGLVEKHERIYGLPRSYGDVQKLSQKLMRRGFNTAIVKDKTGVLWRKAKELESSEEGEEEDNTQQIEEEIDALVAKFVRIKGCPKNFKEAKKLTDRLLRRGYPMGMIRAKVDPLWKS